MANSKSGVIKQLFLCQIACRSYSIVLRGEGYFPAKNVICLDQYRLSARGNRSLVSTRRVQFNLKPVADPGLSGRGKGGGGYTLWVRKFCDKHQTNNQQQTIISPCYLFFSTPSQLAGGQVHLAPVAPPGSATVNILHGANDGWDCQISDGAT